MIHIKKIQLKVLPFIGADQKKEKKTPYIKVRQI